MRLLDRHQVPLLLPLAFLLPALALPRDPTLARRQDARPYTTTEVTTRTLTPSEPDYPGMTTETFVDVLTPAAPPPPPPVTVPTTVYSATPVVLTTTVVKSVSVGPAPVTATATASQAAATLQVTATITATAGGTTTAPTAASTPTAAPNPSSPAPSTPTLAPPSQPPSPSDPNRGSILHPNADQIRTLWVAGVMLFVQVTTWQMFLLRELLFPYKMFVNLWHEGSHIFVGLLSGAKLYSVSIDPDRGPISGMTDGVPFLSLGAGYLGSQLLGSTFILCSFSISASKVAYISTASLWLGVWWFGRIWSRLKTLVGVAVSVALWFPGHAEPLRFYILFLGIMSTFYPLFDALDDFVFRKQNESDASLFARISKLAPQAWTILWLLLSFVWFGLGVLGGLHYFPQSMALQREAQAHFLPT